MKAVMTDTTCDLQPQVEPACGHRGLWLLLACVAVVHFPSLLGSFFIDDYIYVAEARALDWSSFAKVITSPTMDESASSVWWAPEGELPFYRPVGKLTFAIDHAIWGIKPIGYHITNLLLHLLNTYLVWRLTRQLFETHGARLAAAAAFALNPVHVEAVAWISGRFDLLVCAAALSSVLCYLEWRSDDPVRRRWGGAALLFFIFGLGCKETAIALPAVLIGMEILLPRNWAQENRILRFAFPVVGFTAVTMAYLVGRFMLFGGLGNLPPPYGIDRASPLAAMGYIGWNVALYMLDFVLCIPVDAVYITEFWQQNGVLFAALLCVALILVSLVFWRCWGMRSFRVGLLWLTLFITPALITHPGERNVYLASAGAAVILGAVYASLLGRSERGPEFHRWAQSIAISLVGAWVLVSLAQQGVIWYMAAAGEKVYRDIEEALPDPPIGTRIFVVNQSPLNSVGFEQALRLRYGRSDLIAGALTLAPRLNPTCRDVIVQTSADSVRINREGGDYFESYIDRFHLFAAPVTSLSQSARRMELELLDPPVSFDGLRMFHFRLPFPIDDPRTRVFVWDNTSIHGHFDYKNIIGTARLVPWHGTRDE